MQPSISEKIIKPANCVLGFAIPVSKDAFDRDNKHPNKNFARKYHDSWDKYYYEFISDFKKVKPIMTDLGVEVCTDLSLDEFGELLGSNRFDVIILFSHWNENAIEFREGFIDIASIVEKVPDSFSGIIDLCVCHPEPLVIALRRERPNCLIRHIDKKAVPRFWLFFYLALFKHLKHSNVTYLKALEDVVIAFLKKAKEALER